MKLAWISSIPRRCRRRPLTKSSRPISVPSKMRTGCSSTCGVNPLVLLLALSTGIKQVGRWSVANPNHLDNLVLNFYAEAVENTPLKAAKVLLSLLCADAGWNVIKSSSRGDEAFSRQKLMRAIRAACRDAGCNDIVIPVLVLPKVIESLEKSNRRLKKQFTTGDIHKEVMASFVELEAEPATRRLSKGFRQNGNSYTKKSISLSSLFNA